MRLHSLTGATAVDDPEFGHFEPDKDGGFVFPGPLADRLHSSHVGKRKQWETEIERQERLHGEDLARRQDPATLYNAVADIANITKQLAGLRLAEADGDAGESADKRARRRSAPASRPDSE